MAFDLQPTLRGPRITIRPVAEGDWSGLFAAAADPEIWVQHPASDRYQETVFRQYFDEALESGSAFVFVDDERERIIGSSRYHGLDPVASEIEIGWTFLARDYWGGSYNREIKILMLEHAFRYVDIVVLWIGVDNVRSRRATEKLGAVLREGGPRYRTGTDMPHVVYEIRRGNWTPPGETIQR